jgi:acyl carrier protein
MERAELARRVEYVLVDLLMIEDRTRVVDGAHIVDDLGAESLQVVELAVALEDEFDLVLPLGDVRLFVTVGALVDYLHVALTLAEAQAAAKAVVDAARARR